MPFHRWVGGKRWLASEVLRRLGTRRSRLFLPFYGGGGDAHPAIASGAFSRVFLSDSNPELVAAHEEVRDEPARLVERLRRLAGLSIDEARTEYEALSAETAAERLPRADRAYRFVALVGMSFGGLWRENGDGRFNAPFNRRFPFSAAAERDVLDVSWLLRRPGVSLEVADFRAALAPVRGTDAVYADPPYCLDDDGDGFVGYRGERFPEEAHVALSSRLLSVVLEGGKALVSNSDTAATRRLYPWRSERIKAPSRKRDMSDPSVGGSVFEVLINVGEEP